MLLPAYKSVFCYDESKYSAFVNFCFGGSVIGKLFLNFPLNSTNKYWEKLSLKRFFLLL